MAIGTGTVSMSQLNTELGRSSTATISLNTAENGGYAAINPCSPSRPSSNDPATISEWQGYNHSFACEGPICYEHYSNGTGEWHGVSCGAPAGIVTTGYNDSFGVPIGCFESTDFGAYHDGQPCLAQCPTPDMPILINPNTWVTAVELKVGDYVYTKHETTGDWGSYQVSHINPGTNTVSRTVIGGQVIKVSHNHRFLTESMGFVALSELWVGAKVQTIDGVAEIESIEDLGELPVIQIEVADAHTYVIRDVVSHNIKVPECEDCNEE